MGNSVEKMNIHLVDTRTDSILYIIPEQFTVKAHPALFEGEGEGGGAKKLRNTFPS